MATATAHTTRTAPPLRRHDDAAGSSGADEPIDFSHFIDHQDDVPEDIFKTYHIGDGGGVGRGGEVTVKQCVEKDEVEISAKVGGKHFGPALIQPDDIQNFNRSCAVQCHLRCKNDSFCKLFDSSAKTMVCGWTKLRGITCLRLQTTYAIGDGEGEAVLYGSIIAILQPGKAPEMQGLKLVADDGSSYIVAQE